MVVPYMIRTWSWSSELITMAADGLALLYARPSARLERLDMFSLFLWVSEILYQHYKPDDVIQMGWNLMTHGASFTNMV